MKKQNTKISFEERQAKDILNYVLDCFQIKRFIYVNQEKEMLEQIKNYLEGD